MTDSNPGQPNQARRRRQRLQKRRQIQGADSICETLLVVVVVGSALAIGTVHVPSLLFVSLLAIAGGTLSLMANREVPKPAIALAILGLCSALQAVPLPASWLLRISPVSAQVWLRCLSPFGEHPLRNFPISLDDGASIADALKWFTYASVYLMAARVRARRDSAWLATLLFGSVVLVALITLIQGVADLRQLYGLYQPNFGIGRWNVGPLLNSNNLAGYAIVGLFAGSGLLLSGRSPLAPVILYIGLGAIATALLLSGSRAGVISAVAGGVVALVWLRNVQRFRLSARRLALGITPFVIGAAVAVGLGTSKESGQLISLDVRRKIAVWEWSVQMIRDHFWVGVGRGAFETAFPPYRQAFAYDWTAIYTHAENFAVQWLAEWGVPIGLAATLVVVGYALREWSSSSSDRLRFMLMTGLIGLLLQNLADLGLEIPAVTIAAVVALAAGERPMPPATAETRQRFGVRALAIAAPILAIWVGAIIWSTSPVEVERRELSLAYRDLPVKSRDERDTFRSRIHDAMLRHPGEAFFPQLEALVTFRARSENPLPWISRALELAPSNGRVHLVLAELLGAHHLTRQAMLHLRLASQYDGTVGGIAASLAARWAPSVEILLEAIPEGPGGDAMLSDACGKQSRIGFKVACFREATLRSPQSVSMRDELADSLLFALRSEQAPCNGYLTERCDHEVESTVRAMSKLDPRSWRPGYLLAELFLWRGQPSDAAKLLARVCPSSAEGDVCSREAVTTAIKSGSDDAISTAANAYAHRPCESSASCAEALKWLGSTLETGGKLALAVPFYTKAAEADDSAPRWLVVADSASQAHLYGLAREALRRADHSPDATPNSRAHSDQIMRRVARSLTAGSL